MWQWALKPEDDRTGFNLPLGHMLLVRRSDIYEKIHMSNECLLLGRGRDKTCPHLPLHKLAVDKKVHLVLLIVNIDWYAVVPVYPLCGTLAIWTTLGNSVRQEMGITSWCVFSFVLKDKEIEKYYCLEIIRYFLLTFYYTFLLSVQEKEEKIN